VLTRGARGPATVKVASRDVHRHDRLSRHALLRAGFDTGSCPTPTSSGARRTRTRLLLPNGRLRERTTQTTARAVGVMQAATKRRSPTPEPRRVREAIIDFELTRVKLGTMATIIQCARQFSLEVAREMARGGGTLERRWPRLRLSRGRMGHARSDADPRRDGYAEEYR